MSRVMSVTVRFALALALIAMGVASVPASAQPSAHTPPDLLTTAEKSDYTATSRCADVMAMADRLAAASKFVRKSEIGATGEGRSIPLLIIADPPIASPEEAVRSNKPVILLMGNIHAGEVEGKEALMMLARELALQADEQPGSDGAGADQSAKDQKPPKAAKKPGNSGLLKDLIVAIVPIYNADGNEKVGPVAVNRPGQDGPGGGDGVGIRENAAGLDLNRDYVKLEAPETRALVKFIREWDPALVIDCHTTNGSHHRYTLTYMGPTNPAGEGKIVEYVRDTMLPAVGAAMLEKTDYRSFFYGNFEPPGGPYTKWTTYPDLPRYGTPYIGMRSRLGILSEAYSYAPFKERVLATLEFCRDCLRFFAQHKGDIRRMERETDELAIAAGRDPKETDLVAIRSEVRAFEKKVTALGFVEEDRDGKHIATETPKDYEVDLVNDFVPAVTVRRPYAYVLPSSYGNVIENLLRHGVIVEELREDLELDAQAYRVESVAKAKRSFQGHSMVDVNVAAAPKTVKMPVGTIVVRTGQPLGNLVVYLLEPRSADGLTAWNFFDDALSIGGEFPVLRLPKTQPLLTARVRPLAEGRKMDRPVTYAALYEAPQPPNFSGSPIGGLRWLGAGGEGDEGPAEPGKAGAPDAYLQVIDGTLRKVDASTGRSERFFDPEPVIAALAKLPTIGEKTARSLAGNPFVQMNSARTGAVFNYDNDLYYAAADGSSAARLTSTPEPEENYSWSPDGRFIAFIRSNDLWVVDIATRTERALTSGGTDLVRNGKNDWVYFEELYNRNWRAYWWSPDSKRIAYLQVDSTQVPTFTLPVDLAEPQGIEKVPYPKPGQPNPAVKFGMVTVGGGSPRLADLSDYDAGQFLITGVGWFAAPEGQESPAAYCFVQNRTQTWMDMVKVPVGGGKPVRLFRETTPAWVEPLGNIRFLKDGSFLFPSERSGYKHWYRYDKDGKLIGPVTHGDFEARTIAHIDESAGLLYFTGTADSPIAENLYRIGLDGNGMSRLTSTPGSHSINFAPSGRLYIDSWSDHATPTRVALCSADGAQVRMLDTNPVYSIEEYRRGEYYLVHIPMSDGFILEGSVLSPPRIDPAKKYPVWLMTYAGPHAPTVSDTWGGGRTYDEMLAQMGIIVFRVDPRSASGKGAQSAWTAYKQLGVQELNDLEHAVKWLCSTGEWAGADSSPADSSRVGIAGGSYGGFMTAYAMTHSTAFAAGIATSSVTDWRDYDSIYTERYMGLPQDNPEGYDRTSVVKGAKNLHGTLLLQHGTMDDNVHMQNSIRLVRALEDAGKQFEFMVYPGSRHGVGGRHSRRMSVDFIRRVLGTGGPDD